MAEKDHSITLESLLREYAGSETIARDLDKAMLSVVLQLRHESRETEKLIQCYETLYELKNLILNYKS